MSKAEHGARVVQQWLAPVTAHRVDEYRPATATIGLVMIAYQRAFHHLRVGATFQDAIRETVQEGGDTDTNAAIVGGLLGARRPRPSCGCTSVCGRGVPRVGEHPKADGR